VVMQGIATKQLGQFGISAVLLAAIAFIAVSYTHLDVYKRQTRKCSTHSSASPTALGGA